MSLDTNSFALSAHAILMLCFCVWLAQLFSFFVIVGLSVSCLWHWEERAGGKHEMMAVNG